MGVQVVSASGNRYQSDPNVGVQVGVQVVSASGNRYQSDPKVEVFKFLNIS